MDMLWRNKYCKLYMDVAHIVIMCNRQHMSRLNSGKVLVQTWGKMTYKVLGFDSSRRNIVSNGDPFFFF